MQDRIGQLRLVFDERQMPLKPRYELEVGDAVVVLNEHIGQGVTLRLHPQRHCIHCSASVRKLYGGGYCYDCFTTLARCDLCVVSPERCHYEQGTCREPEWGEAFCMQPHVVYLSNTSGPKIGITRADRVLRRWLDQGARQGLVIAHVPTRHAAGLVEAHFKRHLNDRTDWRRLVSGEPVPADLRSLARELRRDTRVPPLHWQEESDLVDIEYPVQRYSPPRRVPLTAQQPSYADNLQGLIGQYLLFGGGVLNLGAYRGMTLSIEFSPALDVQQMAAVQGEHSDQMSLFD